MLASTSKIWSLTQKLFATYLCIFVENNFHVYCRHSILEVLASFYLSHFVAVLWAVCSCCSFSLEPARRGQRESAAGPLPYRRHGKGSRKKSSSTTCILCAFFFFLQFWFMSCKVIAVRFFALLWIICSCFTIPWFFLDSCSFHYAHILSTSSSSIC